MRSVFFVTLSACLAEPWFAPSPLPPVEGSCELELVDVAPDDDTFGVAPSTVAARLAELTLDIDTPPVGRAFQVQPMGAATGLRILRNQHDCPQHTLEIPVTVSLTEGPLTLSLDTDLELRPEGGWMGDARGAAGDDSWIRLGVSDVDAWLGVYVDGDLTVQWSTLPPTAP